MTKGDKIGSGVVMLFLLSIAFLIGTIVQSYTCIGFLEDGRKFVSIRGDLDRYIIEKKIWTVEKLPNGFYRCR